MATPALLSRRLPDETAPGPASAPTAVPPRKPKRDRYWLHALLFLATLTTTTAIGMRYQANFDEGLFPLHSDADVLPLEWAFAHVRSIAHGLPFSCTLLGILLAHEFGHYFAARHYKVRASLPYLLPAPSLSGTAGAVIRLRSRIKSSAALLAIGAMGPISGFIVALVTTVVGLLLSRPVATPPAMLVHFQSPLLVRAYAAVLDGVFHVHRTGALVWHPVLIASWAGLLITALNLVPAGQLDGGHVLYSLSPRVHRLVTPVVLCVLIALGVWCWVGWLLWTALLLLPGMRHPTIPASEPIGRALGLTAPLCLVIFVLCWMPAPFAHSDLLHVADRARHIYW